MLKWFFFLFWMQSNVWVFFHSWQETARIWPCWINNILTWRKQMRQKNCWGECALILIRTFQGKGLSVAIVFETFVEAIDISSDVGRAPGENASKESARPEQRTSWKTIESWKSKNRFFYEFSIAWKLCFAPTLAHDSSLISSLDFPRSANWKNYLSRWKMNFITLKDAIKRPRPWWVLVFFFQRKWNYANVFKNLACLCSSWGKRKTITRQREVELQTSKKWKSLHF